MASRQPSRPSEDASVLAPDASDSSPANEPKENPVFVSSNGSSVGDQPHGRRRHHFLRAPTAKGNVCDSRDQTLRLLAQGFARWLVTVVFVAAAIGCLFGFETRRVPLSENKKRVFFSIMTAISICLAFNIQSSYKSMAMTLRWKVLAKWAHTTREILLNFGLQAAIAMLGLTYNVVSAPRSLTIPGRVNITDLSHYVYKASWNGLDEEKGLPSLDNKNGGSEEPSPITEAYLAHVYGVSGWLLQAGDPSNFTYPTKEVFERRTRPFIYDFDDHWVYQFYEIASQVETLASYYYSDRTVNVTWSCREYNVIEGGDGRSSNITYDNNGNTTSFNVGNPEPNSITYLTNTDVTCGPRCEQVWAFQTSKMDSENLQVFSARLFQCYVNVTPVGNVRRDEHVLPDEQARFAASAIARQGFPNDGTSWQWQRYPDGFHLSDYVRESDQAGRVIGRFAIGAIAATGGLNPEIEIPKETPIGGLAISLRRTYALLILCLLVVIQLLSFVATSLWASSVVVKDVSAFATARLLRPLVSRLGDGGTMFTGKDIAAKIPVNLVYGTEPTALGTHRLTLDEGIPKLKHREAFPSGLYD